MKTFRSTSKYRRNKQSLNFFFCAYLLGHYWLTVFLYLHSLFICICCGQMHWCIVAKQSCLPASKHVKQPLWGVLCLIDLVQCKCFTVQSKFCFWSSVLPQVPATVKIKQYFSFTFLSILRLKFGVNKSSYCVLCVSCSRLLCPHTDLLCNWSSKLGRMVLTLWWTPRLKLVSNLRVCEEHCGVLLFPDKAYCFDKSLSLRSHAFWLL